MLKQMNCKSNQEDNKGLQVVIMFWNELTKNCDNNGQVILETLATLFIKWNTSLGSCWISYKKESIPHGEYLYNCGRGHMTDWGSVVAEHKKVGCLSNLGLLHVIKPSLWSWFPVFDQQFLWRAYILGMSNALPIKTKHTFQAHSKQWMLPSQEQFRIPDVDDGYENVAIGRLPRNAWYWSTTVLQYYLISGTPSIMLQYYWFLLIR